MTSGIFHCSRQRAMHIAQEVLKEMNLQRENIDPLGSRIHAFRKRGFMRPSREVEIVIHADESRLEVAVKVEPSIKVIDFGTSEYLEEEFLVRLRERLN